MTGRVETDVYGTKRYYRDGKLHRDGDFPVVEYSNGTREYYMNGKLHRDGGFPAVEYADGSKTYWKNGERHREGGLPAVERKNGHREYWVNGKLQRDGGLPAFERADGSKEYWLNGIKVTEEQAQFFHKMKMKRVKRVYWIWGDITYQIDKPAFRDRMIRDMDVLENEIGYKLI